MSRRRFVSLVAGATATLPLGVRAQKAQMPVIGFLSARAADPGGPLATAFRRGLNEVGYIEGVNVSIDYRWANNRFDRLPGLAADLVQRHVSVIVAISGSPAALAAKAATTEIPVVFANGGDPIASGLVTSYARPTANITGVTFFTVEMGGKRLQLLHELLPKAAKIALLTNPKNSVTRTELRDSEAGARALGLRLNVFAASSSREIDTAFEAIVRLPADALVVTSDPLFVDSAKQLVDLAARHRIATMFFVRDFVDAGGLISYGTSWVDAYREAGGYAGKILNGAKPAELPVLQPKKFELVVNLGTFKAMGLTIPDGILARADEVIE